MYNLFSIHEYTNDLPLYINVKKKTKDGSEKKEAGPEGAEGAGRAGAQKEDIAGRGRGEEGEGGRGAGEGYLF